jgi:transcriptional regulator with XRE-family HTH domain
MIGEGEKMTKEKAQAVEGFQIGHRLEELRNDRRMTLIDLAAKTGLERNLLSEIEKGEVVPPVATLLKLAKALNVGMAAFFDGIAVSAAVSVTRKGERVPIKRRPHHHEGEVDYVYESLETKKPGKNMEPFIVEFMPMEIADMVFSNHEGEEFHYILEGKVEFRTNDCVEVLEPGDSIYFESGQNHSFRSLDKQPSKVIAVIWAKT